MTHDYSENTITQINESNQKFIKNNNDENTVASSDFQFDLNAKQQ